MSPVLKPKPLDFISDRAASGEVQATINTLRSMRRIEKAIHNRLSAGYVEAQARIDAIDKLISDAQAYWKALRRFEEWENRPALCGFRYGTRVHMPTLRNPQDGVVVQFIDTTTRNPMLLIKGDDGKPYQFSPFDVEEVAD